MGVNGGSRGNSNSDSDLSEGYLMGYVLILEDRRMQEVYEYWIQTNNVIHLNGGIVDESIWETRWREFAVIT